MRYYTRYTHNLTPATIGAITDILILDLVTRAMMVVTGTVLSALFTLTLL